MVRRSGVGYEGQARLDCEGEGQEGEMRQGSDGVCIALCIPHVSWANYSAFSAPLRFLYLAFYISSPTHPLQVFVACRQRELLALRCYSLLGRR